MPIFVAVKMFKNIVSFIVLIPFLVSMSGVLLVQTHCNCTGKVATSLFTPPEGCGSLHADHQHLFECHADDLAHVCTHEHDCCEHSEDHDCGCESPEAKFLKNRTQFTEEKALTFDIFSEKEMPALDIFTFEPGTEDVLLFKYLEENPPPLLFESHEFIYFICQPKIPGATCFLV